ncbi:MAG: Ni,Fe-hydrogenase maturation factor [Thermoproteaceae archaeon]|nr:Ni,Fe-hydrogenase maturation factor [Thermoproteaceae archaeon]
MGQPEPGGVLIACVGYLLGGDLAIGLYALKVLRERGYPAIELSGDVFTMLDDLRSHAPRKLILVGAVARGRRPGTVEVYRLSPRAPASPWEVLDAIRPSLEGRISLEDLLAGLSYLERHADEIYVVECEPPDPGPRAGLSEGGAKCLEEVVRRVEELYASLQD